MDTQTIKNLDAWRATLTDKEIRLHALAAKKLKKSLNADLRQDDGDNGSYFPEFCHAFTKWLKSSTPTK